MNFESNIINFPGNNSHPLDDFDGLSPDQMHIMLYEPFDSKCYIQFFEKLNNEILTKIPAFNIALEILKGIHLAKQIKLTPKGNFPRTFILDVYNKKFFPDKCIESGVIKIRLQADWPSFNTLAIVLSLARLTGIKNNRISLPRKVSDNIEKYEYSALFIAIFKAFTSKFNWAYNDNFANERVGQFAFMHLLYLLRKYGHTKKDLKFYSNLYFKAFPQLWIMDERFGSSSLYDSNEKMLQLRFFERFAEFFGLAAIEEEKHEEYFQRKIFLKKTPVLDEIVSFKM